MSAVMSRWNRLSAEDAAKEILPCCGSWAWARGMAAGRPFADVTTLLAVSDQTWRNLTVADWTEAFRSHPRIGESCAAVSASPQSSVWSAQEQRGVATADDDSKLALAEANRQYEQRFGRIFIVCATGKSVTEILEILRRRLQNDDDAELREAAEQQRQIIRIRLVKWLSV